jgi:hypothetical protein
MTANDGSADGSGGGRSNGSKHRRKLLRRPDGRYIGRLPVLVDGVERTLTIDLGTTDRRAAQAKLDAMEEPVVRTIPRKESDDA